MHLQGSKKEKKRGFGSESDESFSLKIVERCSEWTLNLVSDMVSTYTATKQTKHKQIKQNMYDLKSVFIAIKTASSARDKSFMRDLFG